MRFLLILLSLVLQWNVSGNSVNIPTENCVQKTLNVENSVADFDCPFRYQGQYHDSETGLYYNRFRYYSPDEGMYLSQDPIGLAGNNPTLYAYVHDPNSWVDVLGLDCGKPTKYHKRTTAEVEELRKAFDKSGGARELFLKDLAKDPKSVKRYGVEAVESMKKGNVPKDMVVHHKKPLFRGGTNDHDNLILLDKKYHSDNSKALHWYEEGNNPFGLN
jgi:RHS repeat-associated protein